MISAQSIGSSSWRMSRHGCDCEASKLHSAGKACLRFRSAGTLGKAHERLAAVKPRDRHLGWIGIIAGFVGVIVLEVAPLEDLLTLNRVLFALICTLMVIWMLVSVTTPEDG